MPGELPLPSMPESHREVGCFWFSLDSVSESSDGFRVTALVQAEIDWERIIRKVRDSEVGSDSGLAGLRSESMDSGMSFEEYTLVFTVEMDDGTTTVIDLREEGYGDAIVETLIYARDELGLPVEDPHMLGEAEFAWESSDGKTWTRRD